MNKPTPHFAPKAEGQKSLIHPITGTTKSTRKGGTNGVLRDVIGFLKVLAVLYVVAATVYGTFCFVRMVQSMKVPSVSYEVKN